MTVGHDLATTSSTLILCAPDDAPAMRAGAPRLNADGLASAPAADLPAEGSDSPNVRRAAIAAAGALVVCPSRRARIAGRPVPALAKFPDGLQ
ncbi:MAG: hypothetical protein N2378_02215, partial [Chloroflexaceae bacterium]|nr:hypothetical protein [Chloroflexaceae bacterium]